MRGDGASGALGGQYEVDPEGAALGCEPNQVLHAVWLLNGEDPELIDHNHERGQALAALTQFIQIARSPGCQDVLSTAHFGLKRRNCSST